MTNPTTSQEIARLVEYGEGYALEDYIGAIPNDLAARHNIRAGRIGSAVVFAIGGLDTPFFNRVIGLGLEQPATPAMLDDVMAFFQRAGSQSVTITLCPLAQPAALPEWLQARGLAAGIRWAKMYRGAEPPPVIPTDLRIERIGPEHGAAFAQIAGVNFGEPDQMRPVTASSVGRAGWRHYVAWDGGQPVGTGALFVKGDIGWLGWGTTLASHRRRGAQGAMMAQRIRDGLEAGCRWLVTEAVQDTPEHPNPSYHNMVRTGFTLAYQRQDYVLRQA